MAMPGVGGVNPVSVPSGIGTVQSRPAGDSQFSDVISGFLKDVNGQHLQADEALKDLVTGKSDSVHDVVLSVAKADLAFRMVLEIRNRLIDSYQEIMRMQV